MMKKSLIIGIILLITSSIITSNILSFNCGKNNSDDYCTINCNDLQQDINCNILPIYVYLGEDIISYNTQYTYFKGAIYSPYTDRFILSWDFDEDNSYDCLDIVNSYQNFETKFYYKQPGEYSVSLTTVDANRQFPPVVNYIKVFIKEGYGDQKYICEKNISKKHFNNLKGDGIINKYVVMINGGYETRFWEDVNFTYIMLKEDYDYNDDYIFLLNNNGTDPHGNNPNNIIDYPVNISNIYLVFSNLSEILDNDDFLFIWVTDHGMGYLGPASQYYGYLNSYDAPFIDEGDEQDYVEHEFKLRSFCVYGDYYSNIGMDVWKVQKRWVSFENGTEFIRLKYVSHFSNIYIESNNSIVTDNDLYIEEFTSYLKGDFNQDGIIKEDEGEIFDFDNDGIPPYNPDTGIFDEDDWRGINHYEDNITWINTGVPQNQSENYKIFDANLDNHVDIDLHYIGGDLEIDGTDIDNQGLFDGIDINEDGDMADWISIDEQIYLFNHPALRDDQLRELVNWTNPDRTLIFLEPCFSGGFIWDLSRNNRIICTAAVEEDSSWGNVFVRGFTSALHGSDIEGTPVNADANNDGKISVVEAFNYAAENDYTADIPQYDDNGDKNGHTYPIPNGGDGNLGSVTFLSGPMDEHFPPILKIIKPTESRIYLVGHLLFKRHFFTNPIIFGKITVETIAIDNETGVDRVEFYVDDVLNENISYRPFSWVWDEKTFSKHSLRVVAYDIAGNSASDEITVWKFF